MFVIIGLVCRFKTFKAPEGGFRNVTFDPLYRYIYAHKACKFQNFKLPTALGFRQN